VKLVAIAYFLLWVGFMLCMLYLWGKHGNPNPPEAKK
jgi:hypothetical protein